MNDTIEMLEIESHAQSCRRDDNFYVSILEVCNDFGFFLVRKGPMKHSGWNVAVI